MGSTAAAKFCELPDDILIYVLSFLPTLEAARTSILARRWRNLWMASTNLTLDVLAKRGRDFYKEKGNITMEERRQFIEWANWIMDLVSNSTIDSFNLWFNGYETSAPYIDKWIKAAMAKKARNLDIDLSPLHPSSNLGLESLYRFPHWFFTQETGSFVNSLCLNSCIFGPLDGIQSWCFSSIVDLQLKCVTINQEDLDKLLFHCSDLGNLSLVDCFGFRKVEILGHSHKLKSLTASLCNGLKEIVIDNNAGLTRLVCSGTPVNLSLANVPPLTDLTITTGDFLSSGNLRYAFGKLSTDFPNLESLFLSVNCNNTIIPIQLPLFSQLMKLVLMVNSRRGEPLWSYLYLLKASPRLQRLELHLEKSETECELLQRPCNFPQNSETECELLQRPCNFPHLHLKEILLAGYSGTDHETEFTQYLVANTTALEKITVDYREIYYDQEFGIFNNGTKSEENWEMSAAKVRSQLINVLRPGVELLFVY